MIKLRVLLIGFLSLIVLIGCSQNEIGSSESSQNQQDQNVDESHNRLAVGSSANDILSATIFDSLVIELVYVEGYEPTQEVINNFLAFIDSRVYKPNGISIEKRAITSPGLDQYSIQMIRNLEMDERQYYNGNSELAIWMLFIDGESENSTANTSVLGTAYWNTSFVIFSETISNLSSGPFGVNENLIENAVINHELGHLFGLTNLGTPMVNDHEDPDHPKHCNNENCLMYWAIESSSGIQNMTGMQTPPELDSQCITDLQANGGK